MSGLSHWDDMRSFGRGDGFVESWFCDLKKTGAVEYKGLHSGEKSGLETFILYPLSDSTNKYRVLTICQALF